jgi:hypothetical protein
MRQLVEVVKSTGYYNQTKVNVVNVKARIVRGESYSSIAKLYNVTPAAIAYYGHAMGLARRKDCDTDDKRRVWTPEKMDRFLTTNKSTIRRASPRPFNIKVPMRWKCTLCGHTWEQPFLSIMFKTNLKGCVSCGTTGGILNHEFLDKITPFSAFFLGAVVASGKIVDCARRPCIFVRSGNTAALDKINMILASTYKMRNGHHGADRWNLKLYSRKLVDRLVEMKLKPGTIPGAVPAQLILHFILGYFTFAGTVNKAHHSDRINTEYRVKIPGSKKMLATIQMHFWRFCPNLGAVGGIFKRQGASDPYQLNFYGAVSTYLFLRWLYDSTETAKSLTIYDDRYRAYLDLGVQVGGTWKVKHALENILEYGTSTFHRPAFCVPNMSSREPQETREEK